MRLARQRRRGEVRSVWLGFALLALGASCGSSRDSQADRGPVGAGKGGSAGTSSAGGSGMDDSGGVPALSGRGGGSSGTFNTGGREGGDGGDPGEDLGGSGGDADVDHAGQAGAAGENDVVHGTVVDIDTLLPLAGRTVIVGASLAEGDVEALTTDENGAFTFERPRGVYDAAVVEADGSALSLYLQLSASALVLTHRWAGGFPTAPRLARVDGNLSGGATFPLAESDASDVVAVHLFNAASTDRYLIGAGGPPYGPDYSALARFDAPDPISATLVALGTFGRKDDDDESAPAYTAFSVTKTLELSDGDALSLDLALEPVDLREISGMVTVPSDRTLTGMRQHYRFPYPEALVNFPAADYVRENPLTTGGAFTFELPELDEAGATLCLAAVSEEEGELWTERCGLEFDGGAVSIELQAAPALAAPGAGAVIDATTEFSWSSFDGGVHRLELRPAGDASSLTPAITVFTAATHAVLPSLEALHVALPYEAAYSVAVVGLGPYGSIDEALGPAGVGALIPRQTRRSASPLVDVITTPAPN